MAATDYPERQLKLLSGKNRSGAGLVVLHFVQQIAGGIDQFNVYCGDA